jgi:Na+-transporting NADH:ubiquinone oxidoreductase subunit B/electron transport complex protein RnfD
MNGTTLFERLGAVKPLRRFAVIFRTLDGILFGTRTITAGAPHILDHIELKRYMALVILALLPSTVAAIAYFGWYALAMIITSYICGGMIEVAFALIRKKSIEEGFLVTGLIFPLVLPPTTPLWVVAVGVAFGVFFGKEVFGGTGKNIFNPALVGRLFVTIAFPEMLSASWRAPFTDAITSATPLNLYRAGLSMPPIRDLLFGLTPGSMGELFRIGVIAGGLFLLLTRVSNWRLPFAYLATVVAVSALGHIFAPGKIAPPQIQLLTGGLLFGAFFMATDPVTSPVTMAGKFIAGVLLGIITVLIRSFSGYSEGVMFSIILMNTFAPLIDHMVLAVKYRPAKS